MKKLVMLMTLSFVALLFSGNIACGPIAPLCGSGQEPCNGGCMPAGNVCCGGGSCPSGTSCGPANTCVYGSVGGSSCLSMGMSTCYNNDGTTGCAPLGSSCCGNHRYCPVGYVCGGSCGSECCP